MNCVHVSQAYTTYSIILLISLFNKIVYEFFVICDVFSGKVKSFSSIRISLILLAANFIGKMSKQQCLLVEKYKSTSLSNTFILSLAILITASAFFNDCLLTNNGIFSLVISTST